jgi:hypothetical protein
VGGEGLTVRGEWLTMGGEGLTALALEAAKIHVGLKARSCASRRRLPRHRDRSTCLWWSWFAREQSVSHDVDLKRYQPISDST